MARDLVKPGQRSRTEELRREIEASASGWRKPLQSKNFLLALVIWGVFVAAVSMTALWARRQPLVDHNRVMSQTRVVEREFRLPDEPATEQARSAARLQTPRVYVAIEEALSGLRTSLEGLPSALRDADALDKVEPTLQRQFGLTAENLPAIRQFIEGDGEISKAWGERVARLADQLARTPILEAATFQVEQTGASAQMELQSPGAASTQFVAKSAAGPQTRANPLSVESPTLTDDLRRLAERAGFSGPALDVVSARLAFQPRPTYTFDKDRTLARQSEAAAKIEPKTLSFPEGDVLYTRGKVLTTQQLNVLRFALQHERDAAPKRERWIEALGVVGVTSGFAAAMLGYAVLFVPRIRRNPTRMAAIAALLGGMAIAMMSATVSQPGLIALTCVVPSLLVAVVLCVAYDQRVALAYAVLHALLVGVSLDLGAPMIAAMILGVGVAVWRLREVRDRDALIKMGLWSGLALTAGVFLAGLLTLPMESARALRQVAWDAALAGFGGLLVAGVTLFVLPLLERAFDITTGMTLVELRDPKQPLLRQLQQRAPGTYNHSLNLASLAEAASESIGANGLLAYVGALYHDIGKMNKPDYFVENQSPGVNKHDKLSPAMSLLVIVGHVKDGMELAREFNLPRPLWHFIESHHGTTLVEYFYHRARKNAEAAIAKGDDVEPPDELEYRYAGPKPRTKEAAIVLLCDAVESATRALPDPTAARLDATVRAIASRRLMDGQFDDCDLTLRELNMVVEAVSRTLTSIYHGRIVYPSAGTSDGARGGGGGAAAAPAAAPAPVPASRSQPETARETGAAQMPADAVNGESGPAVQRPNGVASLATSLGGERRNPTT